LLSIVFNRVRKSVLIDPVKIEQPNRLVACAMMGDQDAAEGSGPRQ
jgi:hypothetical protein